ncbi:GH92 family glycosyl hydrolase [Pedobacter sp. L105]|uniref:GH92 family glycosyl hydrolase n=1 Tax=Pedobacter sp. L105 TaxID=1641871 RepID=UPI00131EB03F|nr:GH92 family glycosyl hydrolase [Pedobacter sp. L105]
MKLTTFTSMMNRSTRNGLYLSCMISLLSISICLGQVSGNARFVDPFIGAANTGHTFPGATVPFGMIQASPETGNMGWDYCSGYRYEDQQIWGFSQTHLNGTGIPDLGDLLLQPFTGSINRDNFHSGFLKETEKAYPGYYTVALQDFGVKVELTATPHTAFHQYTYNPAKGKAKLLVDLQSGLVSSEEQLRNRVIENEVTFTSPTEMEGYSKVNHWVERNYYYVIQFSSAITAKTVLPTFKGEKAPRYALEFDLKPGEQLKVKIGLSTVSIAGARANLAAETPGWNFNETQRKATSQWNTYLSRVTATGSTAQKVNLYTSFYHLLVQPNNIADVDGSYRGAKNKVFKSKSGYYYSTLSLWDTYRAAHPLYTILTPERVGGFINTMLEHYDQQGYLPIWLLWGKENFCMIGNHSIPVIADAYLKGIRGFDAEKAFQAIKTSSTQHHPKSDWEIYNKFGYLPFDLIKEESVSRTLEYAYDDYAASQMAKALHKTADYNYFHKRSLFYKNLLDPETKLMRGKDSNGKWRSPFSSLALSHASTAGGDYTEGNAWQYSWSVQHDIKGLSALLGGNKAFAAKLDSLFLLKEVQEGTGFTGDVTGLIGQYAHGNEPSHHIAYLFTLLGKPERTQELVREICDKFYQNKPDGLSGNDDCGQMSAWYFFSAMGFYPVNPVGGDYVFGAPQLKKIQLKVPGHKTFTIEAKNLSASCKYVKSIMLNGKPYAANFIHHRDIMKGGNLTFIMTAERPESISP